MPLELISTIATLITAVVIGATAIAAVVQLRHLRAGNQTSALLEIEKAFDESDNISARDIVRYELPTALADPEFRTYLLEWPSGRYTEEVLPQFSRLRRAAALVANTYEVFGTLVKNRVVEEAPFIDIYGSMISGNWNLLEAFIAITREGAQSGSIWENFEYLAARTKFWDERMPSFYPKGIPRLRPRNPWSSDAIAGTTPQTKSS